MARALLFRIVMLDSRACLGFFGASALVVVTLLSACAVPDYGTDDPAAATKPKKADAPTADNQMPLDPTTTNPPADTQSPTGATCTNDCPTEGLKRCASSSNSGTEVCAKGTDGCRKWSPGTDCAADFSCDKIKNDGSCQAGCTSDSGCSAGNAGVAHCTADGTSELTCTKVGACYVFKTTRTGVAQQCTTPLYCGPTTGRRIECVTSAAGACTQHVATFDDCPSGTQCQGAGQCVATCTNDVGCSASTLYADKCNGSRSRLTCAKSGACYKWLSTTACSPDETCSAGDCIDAPPACTNACTLNTARCVAGAARSRQVCVKGSSGCTVWATGTSCSPDETCSSGVCN